MTIAVELGRKAIKQNKNKKNRLGINITDTGKREKMLHILGVHVHNYNILFLLLSKRYALLFCFVLIKKERSY